MKVFITGCHGLLGQRIVALAPEGIEIMASDLSENNQFIASHIYRKLDLTNREETRKVVENFCPDWILNAAGYTNVDGAERQRDLCWLVNVIALENLAYAARKVHASILHLSTDYIFDGKNGPYLESAKPNPLGFYGKSKLAAENVLKISPLNYTIVRTMVLYGPSKNNRPDFVRWLINKLSKGDPVHIVTDQIGNTTLNDELARAIWQLVEKSFHGIVNVAGREIVSRYDFSVKIANLFDLDKSLINPIKTRDLKQKAPRPLQSGLIVNMAMKTLGLDLSDVETGLQKYKNLITNKT